MVGTGDAADVIPFEGASEQNPRPVDHILDAWSFFDYKDMFRHPGAMPWGKITPSWVPIEHRRRLRAYQLLDSIYKLSARRWAAMSHEERHNRREYGDPLLIVETSASSVLGDNPQIVVKGTLPDDQAAPTNIAKELQTALDEWAEAEDYYVKLRDRERNCQKYGDGVFVIGWDSKKNRPRLRVYDPGMYFPVEDPESDEDYPEKCHIAYEFDIKNAQGTKETWVRRITWELRDSPTYNLPWNTTANQRCFMMDRKWKMDDVKGDLPDFSLANSINNLDVEELDLQIDFLPVVHIPNMAVEGIWGQSVLSPVVQLLDDIVATDTDLQSASALTGSPILGLGGANAPKDASGGILNYGPGSLYETGDGQLSMIDTSHSLDALIKMKDALLDRLSEVARVPKTLLGRVDPGQVRAGVILTLSLAPHSTMVNEMRRIREGKDALVLKFVLRMLMKDNQISKQEKLPPIRLVPGSYLPSDKAEVATMVSTLIGVQAISVETGVALMVAAGYPIEDAQAEINRIEKRDFKGADMLATATNDTEAVRDYLKLGGAPKATTEAELNQHQMQMDEAKQKTAEKAANRPLSAPQNPQQPRQPAGR